LKRPHPLSPPRLAILDSLRGSAIIAMIAYHFCYDLVWFGWVYFDFQNHLFWRTARTIIVGTFILVAGASLSRATVSTRRWRRIALLSVCAALVTLGSYFLFPHRFIFFGILHFLVIASMLGFLCLRFGQWNFVVGAVIIALGLWYQHPWFDQPSMQWLGLMTHKPATEDYVPLFPWLGIFLWGIGIGAHLPTSRHLWHFSFLQWLGRHSLLIYMLHQPLILAVLYPLKNF
jgi:uncharacterized membrane protein